MKIVFNAVSAQMGGAVNYLRTVVAEISRRNLPWDFVLWATPEQARALRAQGSVFQIREKQFSNRAAGRRLWFDQLELRRALLQEGADVLFSTANFAMFQCPCRQVLLMRNALYYSRTYKQNIAPARGMRVRLKDGSRGWLATASAYASDVVMTPSEALRQELLPRLRWGSGRVRVNPYGVDLTAFSATPPRPNNGPARLLFTALYAEHKNVGTLLKAVQALEAGGTSVRLTTTSDPRAEPARSALHAQESQLASSLAARGLLVSPGSLNGREVRALYPDADVFVYPSVVESFGHPLLEAMASGLPVVASDIPVNRELCGPSALYFSPFDADDCARKIAQVLHDRPLREALVAQGQERVQRFTWRAHVDRLLDAFVH